MIVRSLIAIILGMSLPAACIRSACAQNAQAYEYMSASSPLKNGWTVTAQSVPGRPLSTVVTPTPLGGSPATASAPNVTLVPTSLQSPGMATQPMPAAASGGSWVWVPNNGVGVSPQGSPVYTQPTLGITSNNAMKPAVPGPALAPPGGATNGCACQPTTSANYAPPYTTGVPMVPFAPPAPLPGASPPPATQVGTVPTSYSATTPANPSGAAAAGTVAYYPYLTGNFAPVVATQNMPPGAYMGRGIIGQPTAYVDGQPVRNLFRYLFP